VIVVLGTNVWISALEFGGTPNRALFRALTQDQLAISGSISAEIERVLTQRFDRDPVELQALLDELPAQGLQIKLTGEIKGVCRAMDATAGTITNELRLQGGIVPHLLFCQSSVK
jgi:predicted nucleic acid-binding protein